jgi:hypothetical protein
MGEEFHHKALGSCQARITTFADKKRSFCMTTVQLEAVQLTQIEDADGRWRRAFSGRIAGGKYVAVCDELLNLEIDGKVVQIWSRRSTSAANADREEAEREALGKAKEKSARR